MNGDYCGATGSLKSYWHASLVSHHVPPVIPAHLLVRDDADTITVCRYHSRDFGITSLARKSSRDVARLSVQSFIRIHEGGGRAPRHPFRMEIDSQELVAGADSIKVSNPTVTITER